MDNIEMSNLMKFQYYGSKGYFWKIQKNESGYSLEDKSALNQIIKTFIKSFITIKKDSDKDIKKLIEEFIQSIKSFFINISLDLNDFFEYILKLHNDFHSNELDQRREISIKSLEDCKNRFHFTPLLQKTFSKDVTLEERTGVFITEVICLNSFSKEKFTEKFFDKFQSFVTNFSLDKEDIIKEIISRAFIGYDHAYTDNIKAIENNLKENLQNKINSIKPCKLSLLMSMLPSSSSEPSQWELLTEVVVDNEEIRLDQVICLGLNEVLAVCSLSYSNGLLLIISKDYITRFLKNSIDDCDTVICEGSTRNNIIYFSNKQKKAWISFEQDYTLVKRREIQLFSLVITQVKSAVLVNQKEIALINQSNSFILTNFEGKKIESDTNEVVMKQYQLISLSPCMNFILLLSRTETFVFNLKFELILLEYSAPVYCLFIGGSLLCINQNEEGETYTKVVEYPFQVEKTNKSENYSGRITLECEKTLRFGKDLLGEMFDSNKFVHLSRSN